MPRAHCCRFRTVATHLQLLQCGAKQTTAATVMVMNVSSTTVLTAMTTTTRPTTLSPASVAALLLLLLVSASAMIRRNRWSVPRRQYNGDTPAAAVLGEATATAVEIDAARSPASTQHNGNGSDGTTTAATPVATLTGDGRINRHSVSTSNRRTLIRERWLPSMLLLPLLPLSSPSSPPSSSSSLLLMSSLPLLRPAIDNGRMRMWPYEDGKRRSKSRKDDRGRVGA